MGFSLQGNDCCIHMDRAAWGHCLQMAHRYGWRPQGTRAPDSEQWDGSYVLNEFQMVTDDDARAMADALRRAIAAGEDGGSDTPTWIERLADLAQKGAFFIG